MCQHNLPCSIVLPTACFPEGPSPHFTFCSFWRRRPRLEAVYKKEKNIENENEHGDICFQKAARNRQDGIYVSIKKSLQSDTFLLLYLHYVTLIIYSRYKRFFALIIS